MSETIQSIHPQTSIGTVHLKVKNLEHSIQFYTDMIGLRVLQQKDQKATLSAAQGETPLLVLEGDPNALPKQPRTTGLYHFAILVPNRKSLANWFHQIVQAQYPLEGASDHLFSEAIYLSDPDQNGIEVYADRPRDQWVLGNNGELPAVSNPLDVHGLLAEADSKPWEGLPEQTIMGHIHLHVANIQQAKEFYSDVLGFDVMMSISNHALFISAGGYHHHIGLNTWAGAGAPPNSPQAVGLQCYEIVLPNEEELARLTNNIRAAEMNMEQKDGGLLVQDPAGNHILLRV